LPQWASTSVDGMATGMSSDYAPVESAGKGVHEGRKSPKMAGSPAKRCHLL
jgi:hypothetical protein